MTAHRILIEPVTLGERGHRYRITHAGRVLVESSREPLLDACRALLAQGIPGRLEMWRLGKAHPDAAVEIERGAGLTVAETAEHGPVFRRWRPYAADAEEHARADVPGPARKPARARQVVGGPENFRPSAG
jgi:hypothetical protein